MSETVEKPCVRCRWCEPFEHGVAKNSLCLRPVREKGFGHLVTGEVTTVPLSDPCIEERAWTPLTAIFTNRCGWDGEFWEPVEQVGVQA
jgi:hypothetical protein